MQQVKMLSLVVIAILVLALFGSLAHATPLSAVASTERATATPSNFSLAPLNPDFVRWQQEVTSGKATVQMSGGRGLRDGYVPPPVDLSHLTGQHISTALRGYPPTFDLRNVGKVSPVKDQDGCGDCWAFATYGSLESYLLPSESWDFSENNLKNTNGFDRGPCGPGGLFMSTAYLARWSGPVTAADDPYDPSSGVSPSHLPVRKHVQNVYLIPDRGGPLDNDNIKWALMNLGGVMTGMRTLDDPAYDSIHHTYYHSGPVERQHTVTIVGWDDNFDRNLFGGSYGVPPGNGAFIVKNSWGTWWGENGYCYVSYYNSCIGIDCAVFTAEPISNYRHVYQYDPLGWTTPGGFNSDTAFFANVFTAITNEQLSAVSFYTAALNSQCAIFVFKDPESGPLSQTVYTESKGTITAPGYHTVQLSTKVPLTAGHKFSVVVQLRTPGFNFPIPTETPIEGYSSAATASAGQSYISSDGNSWTDMTSISANTNVCLKAFAT